VEAYDTVMDGPARSARRPRSPAAIGDVVAAQSVAKSAGRSDTRGSRPAGQQQAQGQPLLSEASPRAMKERRRLR
jgi:hypothetical protein